MTEPVDVFLSYSRGDIEAAASLQTQIERLGLSVFRDEKNIGWSDAWLTEIQDNVRTCRRFVLLVGREGVQRWVGAETEVALIRHINPRDPNEQLPIFPILLDGVHPEALPAFLWSCQTIAWDGVATLDGQHLDRIQARSDQGEEKRLPPDVCPYVGLDAFGPEDARLFFGRQEETLDVLRCFDRRPDRAVRWVEISGDSGSGKSSLMKAGVLPLIDKGWLWRRTGFGNWRRIGPMMPGARPVEMLAESLARAFGAKMGDIIGDLATGDDALRFWLRDRKDDDSAFLLAIDQFEELFTFAEQEQRRQFDRLLAAALQDPDCPMYLLSTVRSDFLGRFQDDLPCLVDVRNGPAKLWTLPRIRGDALREVITGPAQLAGLDFGEVVDAILDDAGAEPGMLPLVENALEWLWREKEGNRLSGRRFHEHGKLGGILSKSADALLDGLEPQERARALDLLLALVRPDEDSRRHTRRRITLAEAIRVAGGGDPDRGLALVTHLQGRRALDGGRLQGPVRLITVTENEDDQNGERSVNLIHETLIRGKGLDADGKPQPYWKTLWDYIEAHKQRAAWMERLKADTRIWIDNGKRASDLWSHERVREAVAALGQVEAELRLRAEEQEFLGPIEPEAMLAELENSETTHKRRQLIGERLDVLGEPPTRWCVGFDANKTPRIDWCPVKGDKVLISIRSDPNDPLSDDNDRFNKTVEAFRIARYPITVAQYCTFMDADDGWRDSAWWGEDLYRDADGDTCDFGRFGNHPAVYVSWFDAVAFCRWLSRRLRFEVRLPDEWEWQQAATGGDAARKFPWGTDWDAKLEPWRANTFESRLGQATAVGLYPAGASPFGVLDMAGTVWEWCANKFDKPEVTRSAAADFDARVLRGGSWDVNRDFARSAYRGRYNPFHRSGYFGFRVICPPPSAGH